MVRRFLDLNDYYKERVHYFADQCYRNKLISFEFMKEVFRLSKKKKSYLPNFKIYDTLKYLKNNNIMIDDYYTNYIRNEVDNDDPKFIFSEEDKEEIKKAEEIMMYCNIHKVTCSY